MGSCQSSFQDLSIGTEQIRFRNGFVYVLAEIGKTRIDIGRRGVRGCAGASIRQVARRRAQQAAPLRRQVLYSGEWQNVLYTLFG